MKFLDGSLRSAPRTAAGVACHTQMSHGRTLSSRHLTIVNDLTRHAPPAASPAKIRVPGLESARLAFGETGEGMFEITGTGWLKASPYISGKNRILGRGVFTAAKLF